MTTIMTKCPLYYLIKNDLFYLLAILIQIVRYLQIENNEVRNIDNCLYYNIYIYKIYTVIFLDLFKSRLENT